MYKVMRGMERVDSMKYFLLMQMSKTRARKMGCKSKSGSEEISFSPREQLQSGTHG